MSVSQIIVTSRYLKSGSKKSKTKRKNYTKYIATRESVEKRVQNISEKNSSATVNQKQLIEDLLTEFPIARKYLEYEDYASKPTVENASELISTIIERHADMLGNRRNFVGYMAQRPGAERRGEHGLFNDSDAPIILNEAANEIANHPGNVWTHVISLRREDAVRLGYTNSDMWRELVKRHMADIAQAQNIPLANLKWYAAFHDTTHHPHIHLLVYSKNPKQGYLTNEGIKKIRSVFANDIFHDDLQSVYQQQTLTRNELKVLSENVMKNIISNSDFSVNNTQLEQKILLLRKQLDTVKGKKIYGYLPKEIKQTVNEIFDILAHNEHIVKLYDMWCEFEKTKYKLYTQKEKEFPTLIDNPQFRSVKNMIVKAVSDMDKLLAEESPEIELEREEDFALDDVIEDIEVDVPNDTSTSKFIMKWSDDYKAACKALYDKNSNISDFQRAESLLLSEAKKLNVLAFYELGKLYAADKLGAKDEFNSFENYAKALQGFMAIEPTSGKLKPYVQYRIGKMYCYGLGTEQDYAQAFKWFETAAVMGDKYAQFSLANLYYYGKGAEQSHEKAFELYSSSAEKGQPYAAYAVAKMYSHGEFVENDTVKAQEFYRRALSGFLRLEANDQADENLLYKLGRMYKYGLGTDKNSEKANDYFKRSADLGNINAKKEIAIGLVGSESSDEIDKGIEILTELADKGDTASAYRLGKIYLSGEQLFKDLDKSEKYLHQAADENNEYAIYALAKLYLTDEKKDITKAVDLLEKACSNGNIKPFAAYTYAKILLDDNEFHDSAKAIKLLEENTDNSWCSYLLGKIYLFGNDEIEKNKEKAVEWLTLSAEDGNEYAQGLLQNIESYEQEMLVNAVFGLFASLCRVIEDDYHRSRQGLRSSTDRKLKRMIRSKKEQLGIMSDNLSSEQY